MKCCSGVKIGKKNSRIMEKPIKTALEQQGGQRTRPEAGVKNYLLSAGYSFSKTMFRVVADCSSNS